MVDTEARDGVVVRDVILDVVLEVLESDGYAAVRLQDVARRARVSLVTIYRLFPSRDELMLCAVERWMATRAYDNLSPSQPGESLYDVMVRVARTVLEPWERHPRMLEAFHRVRTTPGGERLDEQGHAVAEPIVRAVLDSSDPSYIVDMVTITDILVYGLIGRFADGRIAITDILPTLERALYWLTASQHDPAPGSQG